MNNETCETHTAPFTQQNWGKNCNKDMTVIMNQNQLKVDQFDTDKTPNVKCEEFRKKAFTSCLTIKNVWQCSQADSVLLNNILT